MAPHWLSFALWGMVVNPSFISCHCRNEKVSPSVSHDCSRATLTVDFVFFFSKHLRYPSRTQLAISQSITHDFTNKVRASYQWSNGDQKENALQFFAPAHQASWTAVHFSLHCEFLSFQNWNFVSILSHVVLT